jgi:predicted nucleic acid-binding protein
VSAGSDYIVTGDKDLLRLKQFNGIRIVTIAEFLDIAASPQQAR